jgi:NAD(P)-dependent dehydrogenase (short-subunit alcohol dehydrogenase family)
MNFIPSLFSLENKTAVVTGALGLLGRQHCQALAGAGAQVVVADLDEETCRELAAALPRPAMGLHLEVTQKESISSLKKRVLQQFNHIDILVNNAAVNDMVENPNTDPEESKFENYPLELWKRSLEVNVTGVFLCCQVLGSEMARQGKGSIINIASTYGLVAPDQSLYRDEQDRQVFYKPPAYSTGKGAILSFTRYLAAYWGHAGVRVNSLSPGGVENNQEEFFRKSYASKTPLGRMATPRDYWGAVVFLASDASSYMSGANLVVDGGWTAW